MCIRDRLHPLADRPRLPAPPQGRAVGGKKSLDLNVGLRSVSYTHLDVYKRQEEHDLNSGKDKNGWMYWPLVRGCRALVESLMLGFKALEIAALHAFCLLYTSDTWAMPLAASLQTRS